MHVCVFIYKVAHEIVLNESRNKETVLITENSQTKINEKRKDLGRKK